MLAFTITAISFLWFDFLPDFSDYENLKERKEAFIEYVLPKIEGVNEEIYQKRSRLKDLHESYQENGRLHYRDKVWVLDLAEKYLIENPDIDNQKTWEELFAKVDIIPPSLVIAQAATESAWGTSRFAKNGNNLFGHQCYIEGCGIIPRDRNEDAFHEVESYASIKKSIEQYFFNLNSNKAYKEFRNIRTNSDKKDTLGLSLADALVNYSELGEEYSEIISMVILQNNLQKFDRNMPN